MSVTGSWQSPSGAGWSVIAHGGAGEVPNERRDSHAEGCRAAAEAAGEVLRKGGSSLDAVERAVCVLEDDPRYNAGTGACLTAEGHLELDAAIMEGRELRAGGVCALGPFKNPIAIARRVLEDGQHVLYAGAGAAAFARRAGFVDADEPSMITERAREKWAALQGGTPASWAGGTVGAVARDATGNVAAATSTGGMVGKRSGRVGDTPILGAGTYADASAGAASATGHGEGILRVTLTARAVATLAAGVEPERAACEALDWLEQRVHTTAGIILVDRHGRVGWARSTRTMSYAALWEGGTCLCGT
jgi:L-asparaginase / beta-aspartyl-peptidase